MNSANNSDKRKARRFKKEIDVEFLYTEGEHHDQGTGQTINISKSGALIKTDKEVPVDSVMCIGMRENGTQITALGKVVRTQAGEKPEEFEVGVEMTRVEVDSDQK